MRASLPAKLTYANVMSTLAVFLVVVGGGVAIAAVLTKNSVKSRHIARGAVKTSDLGRNAATGAKVRESTLAQVPSAAQAINAATAATAGDSQTIDGIDSLGLARPAGVGGEFLPGAPLRLDVPGYGRLTILCTDGAGGDAADEITFSVDSNMGPNALQSVTASLAESQVADASVQIFGGEAGNGSQTNSNNVGSIVFRLHQPGGGKGVAFFGQAHEDFGGPECQGSIHAFRIG